MLGKILQIEKHVGKKISSRSQNLKKIIFQVEFSLVIKNLVGGSERWERGSVEKSGLYQTSHLVP